MPGPYPVLSGRRYPTGATVDDTGVNFSVYSRYATGAELLLYEHHDSPRPFQIIRLDPQRHHTFLYWHVKVERLAAGIHYTWRMDGPYDPVGHGWRFDPTSELIDPWARAVTTTLWNRARYQSRGPARHRSMRGIVMDDSYDWEDDELLRMPTQQIIIYEMHVGGFTRHPSSGVAHPGTFAGVIERIPYLRALGITHVELMPVMAFDEDDVPAGVAARGLENFWGYNTHSFFSPHPGYCVSPEQGRHRNEFRDLVKALHQAGIGVILDVVFNHTAEGGVDGPTINFKGFGNETFYHLEPADKSQYRDYTGCGNTVNANHPFVSRFIIDCIEYWVREMHVDGFRFDLASALARGEDGAPLANPPLLWGIELSDTLAPSKIIAEAWDAGGLYQVGSFPGYRWMEWNGHYRDVIRRFVTGEPGLTTMVATRIAGSSDLYQQRSRQPINSVNFVTCHDGFTLLDLVSYQAKHNEANGEENRDGTDQNLSWNCGVEGPTGDPGILALRRRQAKNLMSILLLSQGIPMLRAGDEILGTQKGNNNTWCQNNELGWIDWSLAEENRDMLRFVGQLIALRKRHPSLMRRHFLTGRKGPNDRLQDIEWHGARLGAPRWNDPESRDLAFTLAGRDSEEEILHVMLNMSEHALKFDLPAIAHGRWYRAVDTALASPEDAFPPAQQPLIADPIYLVSPRSLAVLELRPMSYL